MCFDVICFLLIGQCANGKSVIGSRSEDETIVEKKHAGGFFFNLYLLSSFRFKLTILNMASKPELLIEIYTDASCPWCQIGHTRLLNTLSSKDFADQVGQFMTPNVKLLPYILDPRLPSTSSKPPDDVYEDLKNTPWKEGKPPSKKEYYSTK